MRLLYEINIIIDIEVVNNEIDKNYSACTSKRYIFDAMLNSLAREILPIASSLCVWK